MTEVLVAFSGVPSEGARKRFSQELVDGWEMRDTKEGELR
jgi:hypothetical protein